MALHIPVKEQKWNFAKRLVELGADVNEVDVNGLSVLHVIVTQKIDDGKDDCTAFINLLLTKGVNLTARTPGGDSVFHLAARHDNWEIIEQILTQVTDGIEHVDEPDSEGFTILHRLAIKKNRGGRNTLLLQFLLDNGAKCDTLCPSGDSAMHLAVKHGNWGILHVLLCYHIGIQSVSTSTNKQWLSPCITVNQSDEKPGGNLNIKDTFGNTVLHLCAKAEAWQQVNTLLKCGADASLTDDEGETPLNLAANYDNWTVVQVFLEHGADANIPDSEGCKWLVAKTLVECGAKVEHLEPQPLMHFLISKYKKSDHETWLSFLDVLLARGADINCRDKAGRTLLFQRWNDLIAWYDEDSSGSLLHALVDRGANLLLADADGMSLLKYALDLEEHLALTSVTFLIYLGVSTYQPALTNSVSTRSPSQQAFEKKFVKAFEMLVKSGASSNGELFYLNTRYQAELSSRDKTTAETQMLDIVNHAASHPRSLKSLCRLTVSHALGYGPHRMERVESLPLPAALYDYVLFSDLLQITRFNRRN
ncbi:hypothetical protein C0Q70_04654 [Pomacea canaliculata]|uniref:SOCS box domain-containing protein n=1 Tax=Pomacea canaliculata TaxID=400727 RepID=A0A2T7PIZ8_POMCA|nr:hypothetical protein C0Q70_04654 [Pomacea canaliculata]